MLIESNIVVAPQEGSPVRPLVASFGARGPTVFFISVDRVTILLTGIDAKAVRVAPPQDLGLSESRSDSRIRK